MAAGLPERIRQEVASRAGYRCEYCGLPQAYAFHAHEPDHIVPRQHGGEGGSENLAWACFRCNRYQGPNVGSFDPETGTLVPFFNPRVQDWSVHFVWDEARIQPLTAEGRVTVKLFRLNDADRISERQLLIDAGLFFSDQ